MNIYKRVARQNQLRRGKVRFYILNRKKAMSFLNKKVREGMVLKLHGYNLESFFFSWTAL